MVTVHVCMIDKQWLLVFGLREVSKHARIGRVLIETSTEMCWRKGTGQLGM